MAGYVNHVVAAPGDPIIAVLVAPAAIAGEITPRKGGEIGLEKSIMIAIDRARLTGPAIGDSEVAGGGALQLVALGIDEDRLDAEERPCRRTGL